MNLEGIDYQERERTLLNEILETGPNLIEHNTGPKPAKVKTEAEISREAIQKDSRLAPGWDFFRKQGSG